jgi:hypothetical protein
LWKGERKHSAIGNQHSAKPVYRKGRKERKEWKKLEGNFVSSMNRVTHTATAAFDLRVLGGKRGLAEC